MDKNKIPMNRLPLKGSVTFEGRGDRVKWPTIRKAWLNDAAVEELRQYVTRVGRSIIFLDGQYKTNLNKWCDPPRGPEERAVFFEFLMKHPKVKGGIFLLCWIGDYHNGSIYHCGWQYPQVRCWHEYGAHAHEMFEAWAFRVYAAVVRILYKHSDHPMDHEVEEFLNGYEELETVDKTQAAS